MLPDRIVNEPELDRILGEPGPELVRFIRTVSSPLVILGAGGKMGLTVASMARRAAVAAEHPLEVVAASRFEDPATRRRFNEEGIRTEAVDLLHPDSLRHLPDAANIISLVGLKFGTAQDPAMTWAVNTLAPVHGVNRYPEARWVVLSTGNVYPPVSVDQGGATEDHPLTPLGEYANAAVARERLLEFSSRSRKTRMAILRLNYAVELRYGVLVDIALRIARGEPVDLSNGWFNCIWQGDAADRILRALDLAAHPPRALNLCHGDILSVREVATELAGLLNRPVTFTGRESGSALLSNPTRMDSYFGPPPTPLAGVIRCTAAWIAAGGRVLNRPTRFEVRDGRY
ncbi:MAG: NAD-dependent epimerase/dehydratase family protein [Verrucomicrobiae bacterium]|nr:NAD-dependent epimerase/dehydratase family protein [Verrucomicrobiae bacterium]